MKRISTNNNNNVDMYKYVLQDFLKQNPLSDFKSSKWQFHANHKDFIDFEKILNTLTMESPIALITHGKVDEYVAVTATLYKKSVELRIEHPHALFSVPLLDGISKKGKVFYMDVLGHKGIFKEWIKWAKQVKEAQWPKDGRKDNVVRVSIPKI